MIADIRGPHIALGINPQTMHGLEVLVAPGAKKRAVAVEDKNRLRSTMGHVDTLFRIRRDGGDWAEFDLLRQLWPIRNRFVIGKLRFNSPDDRHECEEGRND